MKLNNIVKLLVTLNMLQSTALGMDALEVFSPDHQPLGNTSLSESPTFTPIIIHGTGLTLPATFRPVINPAGSLFQCLHLSQKSDDLIHNIQQMTLLELVGDSVFTSDGFNDKNIKFLCRQNNDTKGYKFGIYYRKKQPQLYHMTLNKKENDGLDQLYKDELKRDLNTSGKAKLVCLEKMKTYFAFKIEIDQDDLEKHGLNFRSLKLIPEKPHISLFKLIGQVENSNYLLMINYEINRIIHEILNDSITEITHPEYNEICESINSVLNTIFAPNETEIISEFTKAFTPELGESFLEHLSKERSEHEFAKLYLENICKKVSFLSSGKYSAEGIFQNIKFLVESEVPTTKTTSPSSGSDQGINSFSSSEDYGDGFLDFDKYEKQDGIKLEAPLFLKLINYGFHYSKNITPSHVMKFKNILEEIFEDHEFDHEKVYKKIRKKNLKSKEILKGLLISDLDQFIERVLLKSDTSISSTDRFKLIYFYKEEFINHLNKANKSRDIGIKLDEPDYEEVIKVVNRYIEQLNASGQNLITFNITQSS